VYDTVLSLVLPVPGNIAPPARLVRLPVNKQQQRADRASEALERRYLHLKGVS
jgi:hypothetical protein